jgi:DNA-binding CsgD family transcriptional regulator
VWFRSRFPEPLPVVDVIVAAGVPLELDVNDGPPMVIVSNEAPRAGAFNRGVRAWLAENAAPAEMAAAIVAAALELTVLTQAQARQWIGRPERAPRDGARMAEALTAREAQVLRMMADGLGNKQIAAQLDISEHTAKFHVAQILAKLGSIPVFPWQTRTLASTGWMGQQIGRCNAPLRRRVVLCPR